MTHELVIKNGLVILETGEQFTELGIDRGKITAIGNQLDGHRVMDAKGLIVSPGMVDAHVHLTELGGGYRNGWEGYVTGTSAAAKGGVTSLIEMPMNQLPATIDGATIANKYRAGRHKLKVDVASLGGVLPANLNGGIQELDEAGVCGYFLSTCGQRAIEGDFQYSDDYTLYKAMVQVAQTGKVLTVHAENERLTSGLEQEARQRNEWSVSAFAKAHPVMAEVEAIHRIVMMAKETGCRISITHVSSQEGIEEVNKARDAGLDVTCEVCLHYLYFNEANLDSIGTLLKCAPPIRDAAQQAALWTYLKRGDVDFVASDHSTCPPELKETGNAFTAWSGVAGLQNNVDVMFDEAVQKRGLSLTQFVRLIATNPADRFGLTQKGRISLGKDADLTFIRPHSSYQLKATDLAYRYQISPYINRNIGAQVVQTLLRGQIVYSEQNGVQNGFNGEFIKLGHFEQSAHNRQMSS